MKKICTKCLIEKEADDFYTQNDRKSGASYCKNCFNKYCMTRWSTRKIEAIIYKGSKCVDCNLQNEHPSVYEFHHLDPSQKDYNWAKLKQKSIEAIKLELDKCVLLCANCHRKRHWSGDLGEIQTPSLRIRNPFFYSIEVRGQFYALSN